MSWHVVHHPSVRLLIHEWPTGHIVGAIFFKLTQLKDFHGNRFPIIYQNFFQRDFKLSALEF